MNFLVFIKFKSVLYFRKDFGIPTYVIKSKYQHILDGVTCSGSFGVKFCPVITLESKFIFNMPFFGGVILRFAEHIIYIYIHIYKFILNLSIN